MTDVANSLLTASLQRPEDVVLSQRHLRQHTPVAAGRRVAGSSIRALGRRLAGGTSCSGASAYGIVDSWSTGFVSTFDAAPKSIKMLRYGNWGDVQNWAHTT